MTDRERKRILPYFVHAPADEWVTEKMQKEIDAKKLYDLNFLVRKPFIDGTSQED